MSRSVRIAATLALLVLCATFLAAQIDFARRFQLGMSPDHYWIPQLRRIWLVGLVPAALLAAVAFGLHRRRRDD
jgi:hypothetical protein